MIRRELVRREGIHMARLLAAAFHEVVSVKKLEELFRSNWNGGFAGTTAAHCPKCHRQFAVFFPSSDEPENLDYLKRLEQMMADNCRRRKHVQEFYLEVSRQAEVTKRKLPGRARNE
jgi:hypothetical protein